ncbi:MAG TPA: DMT family transporter [Geminicoccaceae bacterium]|nr:DMT family transporter [Geminicoccus sp.]HMU50372.1 DMT family transporter [Geminicoccaceae bacterium]
MDPSDPAVSRRSATLVGLGAIGLWALLAPLGVLTGEVPPFLLTGIAFAIGGTLGLVVQVARGRPIAAALRVPAAAWALGLGAFFGYHALYFATLRLLPPVDALLIINLWPLLIVLFSALLPGERLRPRHVLGALAGLAGTGLIVLARGGSSETTANPLGYLSALACALIWSGYSVANRRVAGEVSTEAVTGFCLGTAVLALLASALVETAAWPSGAGWAALLAMGLGPVGAAFFFWDHGTKRGDLRVLGSSAYAAPLIGALLLVLLGFGEPSLRLLLAALLIIGGAALASGDLWRRPVAVA